MPQVTYLATIFSILPFIFVKAALVVLYWTIFKPFRWMRIGIITGAPLVVLVYLAIVLDRKSVV